MPKRLDPKSIGAAAYAAMQAVAKATAPEQTPEWAALTGGSVTTAHTHTGGGAHPDLAAHAALGLTTQAPLDAHAAASDPHAGYVREADANWLDLTDGGPSTLHSHAGGGGMTLLKTTANQTINAGAGVFVDITGLTFPVTSGVDYAFEFYITFRSAATTTGWKASVNCPAGTLDFWAGSDVIANGAAGVATHTERHNVVRDDMTLLTATITQDVDLNVRIKGRYLCTADGTFAARFANELASNTQLVVQKGSWGWWG